MFDTYKYKLFDRPLNVNVNAVDGCKGAHLGTLHKKRGGKFWFWMGIDYGYDG